jgi:hypothetical protein
MAGDADTPSPRGRVPHLAPVSEVKQQSCTPRWLPDSGILPLAAITTIALTMIKSLRIQETISDLLGLPAVNKRWWKYT